MIIINNMNKIIEVATAEIGYKEDPPNSNMTRYGKWFGWDGQMWCGIFVSWVYHHAGYPLGNIGFTKGFAGCQTAVKHFQDSGEVVNTPQQGDIVFFDWNKDGRYDHCGIVEANNDLVFRTIEGNTSINNDSNGGEVMLRTRYYEHKTALFVRPRVLGGDDRKLLMEFLVWKADKPFATIETATWQIDEFLKQRGG